MNLPLKRGEVFAEEAYALGKMLDHSSWQQGEKIVRLITPSDIDAVWDNIGMVIFAEFSSHASEWAQIKKGQRWMYESALKNGAHCAVLCRHNVHPEDGKKINSKLDVVSFQPMFWDHSPVIGDLQIGNDRWQAFVRLWFKDPIRLRRWFLGRSAGI